MVGQGRKIQLRHIPDVLKIGIGVRLSVRQTAVTMQFTEVDVVAAGFRVERPLCGKEVPAETRSLCSGEFIFPVHLIGHPAAAVWGIVSARLSAFGTEDGIV